MIIFGFYLQIVISESVTPEVAVNRLLKLILCLQQVGYGRHVQWLVFDIYL